MTTMYKCDILECLYQTKRKRNIKIHKMCKHNIGVVWRVYNINGCAKFKMTGNLTHHKTDVYYIEVKWHNCNKCNMRFKHASFFVRYIQLQGCEIHSAKSYISTSENRSKVSLALPD